MGYTTLNSPAYADHFPTLIPRRSKHRSINHHRA